jgi:diacylglycerol kinase family enzyme
VSGIGVLTNPHSRRNRRDPGIVEGLAAVLGDHGTIAAPDDLAAMPATVRGFREQQVDVVCINGGDGTVHQTVTALVEAYGESALPPIAILRGGTMNIIADSLGVTARPEVLLRQVVQDWSAGRPLPTVRCRTLRVQSADHTWYGFLSGNGIIARFLEVYYERSDPGPADAAWLLLRGSLSALVGGRLIRRLTRPWQGTVVTDAHAHDPEEWTAVAVGTVEQMGLGFRVFHLLRDHPDALQVVALSSSVADLARELPSVYRGLGVHRPGNFTRAAQTVELAAGEPIGLMIDGDFYEAESPVRYSVGPEVRFVVPAAGS